jgi:phthiocerol/phenolphthiocerol synthesis type-I polyketide synthase D
MHTPTQPNTPTFRVVRNRQGRHSLWNVPGEPPAGWEVVFTGATEAECLAHVRRSWTALTPAAARLAPPTMRFGLFFFGGDESGLGRDRYHLVVEAAKFADQHGFTAVWLPERHFAPFGCLYPNPAVLHAALARETKQIRLRAGSVVLPLHSPLRVAEEWSVVDNLSGGRVDLSFASGWNADDFVLAPEKWAARHDEMFRAIGTVERLWQGQRVSLPGPDGKPVSVRIYPTPVQPRLNKWVTATGNPATFRRAGETGANLLTHLFDQELEVLARNLQTYREARRKHGPGSGVVSVTLHTFVAGTLDDVRHQAHLPYCNYLKANAKLLENLARSRGASFDLATLSPAQLDEAVGYLFEKFFRKRSLIGTPESCADLVRQLAEVGVDEVCCLLDFGASPDVILEHLPFLARLKDRFAPRR